MQKYLELSENLINQLSENYKNLGFHFELIHFNVNISVFFILTDSSALSKGDLWEVLSKEIALKYQSKLETIYEKWNLYIIYITKDISPKELKNKIENDKFSSRKIVEDNFTTEFGEYDAKRLITKHITNTDLKEIVDATKEVTISEYIPQNQNLWDLLKLEEKVSGDRDAQGKLIIEIAKL